MMLRRVLVALSLLLLSPPLWTRPLSAQPVGASRGETMAWSSVDDIVRVTVTAPDGSAGEEGFGFVFGVADGTLYVATADHVVRGANDDPAAPNKIQITLSSDQGHRYSADLLDLRLPPSRGDLAVLQLPRPENYVPNWPPYADADSLRQGARAWRIGKLGRWVPASVPGSFVGRNGAIWLAFDNLDTPRGSSGGPIVTEDGIVGMVVADGGASGAPSNVLPIGTIRGVLLGWQLPWNLPSAGSVIRLRARPSIALSTVPSFTLPETPAPAPTPAPTPAPGPSPEPTPLSAFAAVSPGAAQSAAIRNFVLRYYADVSRPNGLPYLRAALADRVLFFGQTLSRDQILSQQAATYRRWPMHAFTVRPDSLTSGCDATGRACHVEGVVDYEMQSPERNAVSTGSERFVMDLDLSTPAPVVVGMQGTGLQRNLSTSSPPPAPAERWTARSPTECASHYYIWSTRGDLYEFTDEAGQLDVERVIQRGSGTVMTETVSSTRRAGGAAIGTRWTYVFEPNGVVRVRNLGTGSSFTLSRCGRP